MRLSGSFALPSELFPVGKPFPPGNLNFFPGEAGNDFLIEGSRQTVLT